MDSHLMDVATGAPGLALRIGSAVSDLTSFVVDIGQDFPLIYVVLKTLKHIRETMDTIKSNQAALDALHERCACITACVIVKCRRSPPSEVDITPLVERIQEVHELVERFSLRKRFSRIVNASSDKVEILRMHERIGELTDDIGLAGILAVERDVNDLKRLLETVDTKADQILTRLPKPPPKLAKVPKGTPARKTWHVKRQRVMDTVCEGLFREGGPHHVGLVGDSGSGKTTAASEIVRSSEVQEFFSDGIVWLSVDKGAKARLPSLMLDLARIVYEDIGGSLGKPPSSTKGGAGYTKDLMDGRHGAGKKLRCLLVADNVWEKKVVSRLRKTGMWVLTTTRDERLVEGGCGEAVVIDEMSEEDAESVLIGASELPAGSHLPEAAKEIASLCGRVAMDLAFVGRWSTTRGREDPLAWSESAEKIRAELEKATAAEAAAGKGGGGGAGTEPAGVGAGGGAGGGAEAGGGGGEGEGSDSDRDGEDNARAQQRRAILRAGFDHLATGTDDDRVQRLYLSLAVIPDGHAFDVRDAAALLYDRAGSAEDHEAVEEVVETLERWAVLRAVGGGKYRMHDAHSSFARESLMDRENVRGPAVERWVEHISSLEYLRSFDTFAMMGLWWALECVGEDSWRWSRRPYEEEMAGMADSDPLCRESLVAVARFRGAKGDWTGEKAAYERLLRVERQALGPYDPTIVRTLWHLGNCAERMENPKEAKEWRQREYETVHLALARIRAQDGGGSESEQSTADGLRSLASGMLRLAPGRLDEAEKLLRRAVEIERARLGPDDVQLAGTLHQLGVCVREAGRKQEAEAILRRVLKIKESKLGPANVYVAVTLHELGVCVRQTGRVKEAEVFLRRALDIWQGKLGLANGCIAYTQRELRMCVPKGGEGGARAVSHALRMSHRLKPGGRGALVLLVLVLAFLGRCVM